ncbi:unnamed protein product [Mytilus coruscus]|uniref:C1q domain-containing protein n=1 Tax=Mytilus coruscus TaxID=42192 RepID=A0A6J8CZQ5_MYTCO|nr:unnamed protein product [Mytilus coruscus]
MILGNLKSQLNEAIQILSETSKLVGGKDGGTQHIVQTVGFHAQLSRDVNLVRQQTVIFDKIITNEGGSYHSNTGHFVSPCNGLFSFTVTFLAQSPGDLHLEMVKNKVVLSLGYATKGHFEAGHMNAVVSLKKGDVVKVQHCIWGNIGPQTIDGGFGFFSGFLISRYL